jgi:hypothetical protein
MRPLRHVNTIPGNVSYDILPDFLGNLMKGLFCLFSLFEKKVEPID